MQSLSQYIRQLGRGQNVDTEHFASLDQNILAYGKALPWNFEVKAQYINRVRHSTGLYSRDAVIDKFNICHFIVKFSCSNG